MRIFGDGCQVGLGRSIIHNGRNWVGRKELMLLSGLPTIVKACYHFGGLAENYMGSEIHVCLEGWSGYEDRDSSDFFGRRIAPSFCFVIIRISPLNYYPFTLTSELYNMKNAEGESHQGT
jgi:hypothetical protein